MKFINESAEFLESLEEKKAPQTTRQGNKEVFHNYQGKDMQNFDKQQIPYTFWYEIEDNYGRPKLMIDLKDLYAFFEKMGFMQIEIDPLDKLKRLPVQIKNNVVTKVDPAVMKKTLYNYINTLPEKITDSFNRKSLHNKIADRINHHVSIDKIEYYLPVKTIDFLTDNKDAAFFFFKNGVGEVTKDGIKLKSYKEIKGYIWNTQIINHDFSNVERDQVDNFDFCQFTKNICSIKTEPETIFDGDRWYSLLCCIGYLLYNYKLPSNSIAVIFTEANLTEDPQGRTGKGLLMRAINYLRRVSIIDGKIFDFGDRFCYQSVDIDTQIVFFDDILKHFDFRKLFSVITEGMSFERKNEKKLKFPPEKSPKIAISTNYTVRGDSESDKGRRFEMELLCWYNASYKPEHDFGRQFFYDYNIYDWNIFYNFMLGCVQKYLNAKKIPLYVSDTHLERRLINETCADFIDFANDNLMPGEYAPSKLLLDFREYSQGNKNLSAQKFGIWVKKYCEARNLKLEKTIKPIENRAVKYYIIS